jgi:hypothetical protein
MTLLNLLRPRKKNISERKVFMRNLLILFSFGCLVFSLTSGVNFVISFLFGFGLPYTISLALGIVVAFAIDMIQQQAAIQVSLDYFKDKLVEPFTVLITLAFIFLSGYISIIGADLRSSHVQLEAMSKDSLDNVVVSTLSSVAPTVSAVVKTKEMSWPEHTREMASAKLKQDQALVHSKNLSLAESYLKAKQEKSKETTRLVSNMFNSNIGTLIAVQLVYLFCCFGIGYYYACEDSENKSTTLSDNFDRDNHIPYPVDDDDDDFVGQRSVDENLHPYFLQDLDESGNDYCLEESENHLSLVVKGLNTCPVCSKDYKPNHKKQIFCNTSCRNNHHNSKKQSV